jgi:hypothetical protein
MMWRFAARSLFSGNDGRRSCASNRIPHFQGLVGSGARRARSFILSLTAKTGSAYDEQNDSEDRDRNRLRKMLHGRLHLMPSVANTRDLPCHDFEIMPSDAFGVRS